MALQTSGTGTNDRVTITATSAINNLAAGTLLVWYYPTDINTTSQEIVTKIGGTQNLLFRNHDAATGTSNGQLRFGYNRSTTNLNIISAASFLTANAWQFIGAAWDASLTNADQHLYRGTLTSAVAEAGSYGTQAVGAGTHDDSAANLAILNRAAGGSSTAGRIGWVGLWNRQLSLAEIQAQQFRPHVTSGCVLFMPLGLAGTGTQPDWSGYGHNGTVTSATVSEPLPLAPIYGGYAGWRGSRAPLTFTLSPGGVLVPAGTLAKAISKPATGGVTPAGAVTRTTYKAATGAAIPAGSLARQAAKGVAGALAPAGSVAKAASAGYSGSLTPTGALAVMRAILMTITGAVTPAGAVVRQTAKALSGALAPAGSLSKVVSVVLAGALTPLGALSKWITKVWTGLVGLAGAVTTQTAGAAQPNVISVAGAYEPTVTAAGAYATRVDLAGSYAPTIAVAGHAEV